MLAYVDFFLGGDEKRNDLPPRLHQRFPMSLLFGGDGSYMTPFSLHNDNIITSLMSQVSYQLHVNRNLFFSFWNNHFSELYRINIFFQSVPPTTWYRFVAGLNAQLRLVRRGCLRAKFSSMLQWLETFANPALRVYGVHVDLAWFQATTDGYCHYGLLIYSVEEVDRISLASHDGESEQGSRYAILLALDQI